MKEFWEFVKRNRRMILGVGGGLIVGVLLLTIGFFSTLLLSLCVAVGAFIGSSGETKRRLIRAVDRMLPKLFK